MLYNMVRRNGRGRLVSGGDPGPRRNPETKEKLRKLRTKYDSEYLLEHVVATARRKNASHRTIGGSKNMTMCLNEVYVGPALVIDW